jgi:tetratricopeptide (TPR) repeat protein
MRTNGKGPCAGALAALFVFAGSASAKPADAPKADALEWAFKFASAIVSDPKDMGKAQEAVVWDLTTAAQWERAEAAAAKVEGWRRGTAYADLATALAKTGRKDEAKGMIAKAEAVRTTVEGWQNPRISAHIANAWAALGEVDKAGTLAGAVAIEDAQQYAGRATATKAAGLASVGKVDEAQTELAKLSDAEGIDDLWWRTAGYVEIGRQTNLPRDKRLKALAEARRTADGIPGWKKAEALESVADEYRKLGDTARAKECLAVAASIVEPLAATMPIKAALLSNLARAHAEVGDKGTARRLLVEAEKVAPAVQVIDRPIVYANTAASFASLGDKDNAKRLFTKSLDEAQTLANARPRALAVVEICRSLAKSGLPLDAGTRERLGTLYAGLKDPW